MKRALHILLALSLVLTPALAHAWGWGWGHTPPASNSVRTAGGAGSSAAWSEATSSATFFWVDHDSAVLDGDDSGAGFGLSGADVLFDAINGVSAASGGSRAMDGVDAAIPGPNAVSNYVVTGSQDGTWGMAWSFTNRGQAGTVNLTWMAGSSADNEIVLTMYANGSMYSASVGIDGSIGGLTDEWVPGTMTNSSHIYTAVWSDGTNVRVGWTETAYPTKLSDFGSHVISAAHNGTFKPSIGLNMSGTASKGAWGRTDGIDSPAIDVFGFGAWTTCPIDNSL